MPLTRAAVEYLLIRRCGRRLAFVNLDGTTVSGSNADLADPIRLGLSTLGVPCADPTNPADADMATLMVASLDQLLDVAELRCLESMLGNLDEVTEKAGTDLQDFNGFAERLQTAITLLRARVLALYGVGTAAPTLGVLDYHFAESGDPNDWPILPL